MMLALCFTLLNGCIGCDDPSSNISPHENIKNIAMGLAYTLIVKDDGSLLGFGDNNSGGLGLGSNVEYVNTPNVIYASNIKAVAAGHEHSLILQTDGKLLACGINTYGQLGDDSVITRFEPVAVSGMSENVAAIAAGKDHSLILKTDGTLWACGNNALGQLGVSSVSSSDVPIQVTGVSGTIAAIDAGAWQSYAVTTDGRLYAWGYNYRGMCGNGSTATVWAPTEVISSGVLEVSAGQAYTLVLKSDGTVWGCGENNFGQLAYTPYGDSYYKTSFYQLPINDIASLSAGGWTGMALKTDGTILTWGHGTEGELGDGTEVTSQPNPVTATGLSAPGGTIVAGWYHMVVQKADGSFWVWGNQGMGQLGDGVGDAADPEEHQLTPKTVTWW